MYVILVLVQLYLRISNTVSQESIMNPDLLIILKNYRVLSIYVHALYIFIASVVEVS